MSYGSNCELETPILLSGDLGYIKDEDTKRLQKDIGEVERMLKALSNPLKKDTLMLESLNPRTLLNNQLKRQTKNYEQ